MAKQPAKRPKKDEPVLNGPGLDQTAFDLICERLALSGSKYKSCEDLGFNYNTVVGQIRRRVDLGDDSWAVQWSEAYDKFRDSLEQEVFRRGRDGTAIKWRVDPKTGERTAIEWQFSDRLLELATKGAFPERYRDRVHVAGTVGLEPTDAFANLSDKAKRAIRRIIMEDLEEQRQLAKAAGSSELIEATATRIEDQREASP